MEVVGEQPAVAVALTDLPGEVLRPDALVEGDPGHHLDADTVRRVWAAVEASTSAATKAAYRSDWARFQRWAVGEGLPVWPASAMVVAAYLTGRGGVSDRPRRRR